VQISRSDFNPNNPLGRHSGAGRNPAIKNPQVRGCCQFIGFTTTVYPLRVRGQNHDVAPLTWEFVNHLDTGLRRYDEVFSNGLFGFNGIRGLAETI
jgi:hypothetical protein